MIKLYQNKIDGFKFIYSESSISHDFIPGFFITADELEQLQLEAWDAAVEAYRIYTECGERSSFNDYLSSKSKEVRSE